MKFSANLGLLWKDQPLITAIHKAYEHGFDAVEFHWPYDAEILGLLEALKRTDLPVMGLNTHRGKPGENGLAALPGRESEARQVIDQGLEWAHRMGAKNLHVMAGFATGPAARDTLLANLSYAADQSSGVGIVIEPLNSFDVPGYFYATTDQAESILETLKRPEVGLMFDAYHVNRMGEPLLARFDALQKHIKHVQFAGIEGRHEPAPGELTEFFGHLKLKGHDAPLGAEYTPRTTVEAGLGWRATQS